MNKTIRYIMYIMIMALCVIAIFLGVYQQFYAKTVDKDLDKNELVGNKVNDPQIQIKDDFKELFKNQFLDGNYDDSEINKIDTNKTLVYDATNFKSNEGDKYDIVANVPIINISNEIVDKYNQNTSDIFFNKINEITKNQKNTKCTIKYTSYINNDILSVAIMALIKEIDKPQRLYLNTYNYDLKKGKEFTIQDAIKERGLDKNTINGKIKRVVEKAQKDANSVLQSGFQVYQRDLTNKMYQVDNVKNFMKGPNGEMYIIYAYGNEKDTSELDVIEV